VDGRGVVDADVDAAEALHGAGDGRVDLVRVADVAQQRQGLAACGLDLARRGVDGARQRGMRLRSLGRNGHVGAVARRAQRDREADAARPAADEQGLAVEGHAFPFGAAPGWSFAGRLYRNNNSSSRQYVYFVRLACTRAQWPIISPVPGLSTSSR